MQCAWAISVACLALQYFSKLSYKRYDIREKRYWAPNVRVCFDILCNFCMKHFSSRKVMSVILSEMYSLHVKSRLFLSDSNETWIFSTYFQKILNVKLHENPSSGSWVVPCGRTEMTKLVAAFRNFANAPKNYVKNWGCCLMRRPREANKLHVPPLASAWGKTEDFIALILI
jgi:hypothetical protein